MALKKASSRMAEWRKTQSAWDDSEFLAHEANAFMKARWKRLNMRCAAEAAELALALDQSIDLLDIGCGHGDFYAYCGPWLRSYVGIEPSRSQLPRARAKGKGLKNFKVVAGQAEKLPLKAASVDFALIKEVLDHCYDPLKVLKEARRVLRPQGLVLITLTNDQAWYKRLMPGLAGRIKAAQHDHLYYFDPAWVQRLAREAGFKNIEARDSHYLRLPGKLESLLGGLPQGLSHAMIAASDACGTLLAPSAGGSFWVLARA